MTIDERLHIIGEFIRRSDEEFDDGGNNLIAAELLWGAVAHGLGPVHTSAVHRG